MKLKNKLKNKLNKKLNKKLVSLLLIIMVTLTAIFIASCAEKATTSGGTTGGGSSITDGGEPYVSPCAAGFKLEKNATGGYDNVEFTLTHKGGNNYALVANDDLSSALHVAGLKVVAKDPACTEYRLLSSNDSDTKGANDLEDTTVDAGRIFTAYTDEMGNADAKRTAVEYAVLTNQIIDSAPANSITQAKNLGVNKAALTKYQTINTKNFPAPADSWAVTCKTPNSGGYNEKNIECNITGQTLFDDSTGNLDAEIVDGQGIAIRDGNNDTVTLRDRYIAMKNEPTLAAYVSAPFHVLSFDTTEAREAAEKKLVDDIMDILDGTVTVPDPPPIATDFFPSINDATQKKQHAAIKGLLGDFIGANGTPFELTFGANVTLKCPTGKAEDTRHNSASYGTCI